MPDQVARLKVDLAPAQLVTDADINDWAADQHIFVSSVMAGMADERSAVASSIERIGGNVVMFERFGGRDDDPEQAYLTEVGRSDIYIGILGERYGKPLPSGYSATHAEYREAIRRGLRMSVWVWDGPLAGPQHDFVDEVRVFHTTGTYQSASELGPAVEGRLRAIAAEALSPWVKVGDVVFRARTVAFDGKSLSVEARVRDDNVVAALEALRPGGIWSGPKEVKATWSGRTENIAVKSVETHTAAGRGARVSLTAERAAPTSGRPALVDVALSDRSPEDLTELAVRVSLFGEQNPLGMMSFMAKMDNPFPTIESMRLPEDAVQPVAHLLLTEALVGSARAERITSLEVGPRRNGARRLLIAWQPKQRYSNHVPDERRVEGQTSLT